jgi:hypothetical protein
VRDLKVLVRDLKVLVRKLLIPQRPRIHLVNQTRMFDPLFYIYTLCVCVYIYIYMYIYMCVCVCVYIYVYVCVCVCVCVCARARSLCARYFYTSRCCWRGMCQRNHVLVYVWVPVCKSHQLMVMYDPIKDFDKFSYTGRSSMFNHGF